MFANSYTNDPAYIDNFMRDLKALDKNINFKTGLLNKNAKAHIDFKKNI